MQGAGQEHPAKPPTKPQARDQHQQIRISHIRFHGAYVTVKLYLIFFIIAPCFEVVAQTLFFSVLVNSFLFSV